MAALRAFVSDFIKICNPPSGEIKLCNLYHVIFWFELLVCCKHHGMLRNAINQNQTDIFSGSGNLHFYMGKIGFAHFPFVKQRQFYFPSSAVAQPRGRHPFIMYWWMRSPFLQRNGPRRRYWPDGRCLSAQWLLLHDIFFYKRFWFGCFPNHPGPSRGIQTDSRQVSQHRYHQCGPRDPLGTISLFATDKISVFLWEHLLTNVWRDGQRHCFFRRPMFLDIFWKLFIKVLIRSGDWG